ncbi:hypothetical protein [Georgenia sp. SUBG003]|uniref:hypothetical protein n=1 Tax=Georgenia sp. SUBG003 TaxID=1497974 RepID=UPI000694B9D2
MSEPFEPNLRPDAEDGIPAADPGPGAPPTAPGFGIEGEEPDTTQDGAAGGDDDGPADSAARDERAGTDEDTPSDSFFRGLTE